MSAPIEVSFQELHNLSYDELFERQLNKAVVAVLLIPEVKEVDDLVGGVIAETVRKRATEFLKDLYNAEYYDTLRKIYDTEERWELNKVIHQISVDALDISIAFQNAIQKDLEALAESIGND